MTIAQPFMLPPLRMLVFREMRFLPSEVFVRLLVLVPNWVMVAITVLFFTDESEAHKGVFLDLFSSNLLNFSLSTRWPVASVLRFPECSQVPPFRPSPHGPTVRCPASP